MVAGGFSDLNGALSSAEVFDPATGTWSPTAGPLTTARWGDTATLLPNGEVLVVGGYDDSTDNCLGSAELYDSANGTWIPTAALHIARYCHTATLLPNGRVLIAGGAASNFSGAVSSAELYDAGLGFSTACQPQIVTATSPLSLGSSLVLTGSRFRGISAASGGGFASSPTDFPLVQLRSLDSGQAMFLFPANWSTNSFSSLPLTGLPCGWTLATVFVNGVPSSSAVLSIKLPVPSETALMDAGRLANGYFEFTFTNTPGALFNVITTTNLLLPMTNWTALGGITEISPGQFQFTDQQVTNCPCRFYRVRSQ